MARMNEAAATYESRLGKLRSGGGFTLTEMLVTTLLLGLVSTLMATGVGVAADTYRKVVNTANAQAALSTTVSAIRGELGLARQVIVKDDEIYYHSVEGYWAKIRNHEDGEYLSHDDETEDMNGLMVVPYMGTYNKNETDLGLTEDSDDRQSLISTAAVTDALDVSFGAVDPSDGEGSTKDVVVRNLRVVDSAGDTLAVVDELHVVTRFTE